jgi:hypothetical protein
VTFSNAPQHIEWAASIDHEVLGDDLDEIHRNGNLVPQKIAVVGLSQAETELVRFEHVISPRARIACLVVNGAAAFSLSSATRDHRMGADC